MIGCTQNIRAPRVYVSVLEAGVWSSANNDLSNRMAAQREREGGVQFLPFILQTIGGLWSAYFPSLAMSFSQPAPRV